MRRSPRAALALGMALLASGALAEWTRVGEGEGIHDAYADREAIRRLGGNVTMPGLYDFRKPDFTPLGMPFRSTVVLREYDCRARQVRMLSFLDFAGPMGSGEVVSRVQRTGRWEAVLSGALDERFWEFACGGA